MNKKGDNVKYIQHGVYFHFQAKDHIYATILPKMKNKIFYIFSKSNGEIKDKK